MRAGWVVGAFCCAVFACVPAYAQESRLPKPFEGRYVVRVGGGGGVSETSESGAVSAEVGWRQPFWESWWSPDGGGAFVVEPVVRAHTLFGGLEHSVGVLGEAGAGLAYDFLFATMGVYGGYAWGPDGNTPMVGIRGGMIFDTLIVRAHMPLEEEARGVITAQLDVLMLARVFTHKAPASDTRGRGQEPVGGPPVRR